MSDTRSRLLACFRLVFLDASDSELLVATPSSYDAWDSIAAITLVNVIEDEFQVQVDFDRVGDLDSFEKVLEYVRELLAANAE
ncbi:MAG: acyl carrier protein [Steroidobacteraceae bacterium]